MMRSMRAVLGVGGAALWAAVVIAALAPVVKAEASGLTLRRDEASCSSGGCKCSVKDTKCSCSSGNGGCLATCTGGQESSCYGGGGKT